MQQLANSASVLAIATYLGVVLYRGNIVELGKAAAQDYGYLEFLIAGGILAAIVKTPSVHPIALSLVGVAAVAMLLKLASGGANLSALTEFGKGNSGLFETVKKLFGA